MRATWFGGLEAATITAWGGNREVPQAKTVSGVLRLGLSCCGQGQGARARGGGEARVSV